LGPNFSSFDFNFYLVFTDCLIDELIDAAEAEKVALVAKIQWDQKIMEKESEKKMAEIEGRLSTLCTQNSVASRSEY